MMYDLKELLNANTGYTGKGVRILLADTGICKEHPMLRGAILKESDIGLGTKDGVGHGTSCASIILGRRVPNPYGDSFPFEGIAPDAKIVSVKVFDSNGDGSFGSFREACKIGVEEECQIISYSGGGFSNYSVDGFVNKLIRKNDIQVVAATGNDGNGWRVDSPASAELSIGVGEVDVNQAKTKASNYGKTYDGEIKPDVVSYGQYIVTATCGWFQKPNDVPGYTGLKGSSFSTATITGILAQLVEANHGKMTREQVEAVFSFAGSNAVKHTQTGWGVISARKAVEYVTK